MVNFAKAGHEYNHNYGYMTHKIIKATLLLLCLALTVSAQDRRLTEKEANDWADRLDEALIKDFWGASFKEAPGRYYSGKESRQAGMSTGDYWPQAHAADVLTDAFLRTSSKKYSQMYDLWWQGMPRFNPDAHSGRQKGDLWWNTYARDMEWHCLALIRIYEATGEVRYLNKARQMYADWIWTQWSPEDEEPWHGGITWKTDVSRSKNACSNGPAAIIAARLALFAPVDASCEKNKPAQEYQGEAQKIYQWERKYLWNAENGAIYDNMNQSGRLGRFSLSYNQGTFIGAAVELYRLTGDKSLLDDAILTARYTTGPMSQRNDGVLPDADGGDGGHWRRPQPADRPSALTSQLTACMPLEAVCKVNAFNMQERAASVQKSPGSLVPSKPSTAPDYYCTWNLQGYVCSYGAGAGSNDLRIEINEDNLFGRELGNKVWGTSQTKTVLNNANPRREVSWPCRRVIRDGSTIIQCCMGT